MAPAPSSIDALLQPVPGDDAAGADLRFSAAWGQILDARGADDGLEKGVWTADQPPSDWAKVAQLTATLLRDESKDLRLAAWYAEARVRLDGFAGAADACQLFRLLVEKYGARLYPRGFEGDRLPFARAVMLFDKYLTRSLKLAPMLDSQSAARGFSLLEFDSAAAERAEADAAAAVSPDRLRSALESLEICAAALAAAATSAAALAPCNFTRSLAALDAWRGALLSIQHRAGKSVEVARQVVVTAALPSQGLMQVPASAPARYPEADLNVIELRDDGAAEPSGRARFYQKLGAVEVCIKSGRNRSARALLSELVEMIDRLHLQEWEPRWATSAVYRNYLVLLANAAPESGDAQLANQIFERWVRFDPPAAMEFESGAGKNDPGAITP
ncbi:MAG TPA: type VI secretion system ImpA family N-terminal domain-containing protein [Candidatus Sulfopaludibacter sp.]|jgi:type VI secretion system ImpA family protein|nr:type VI secretion system ImpA family N-terminal domain-containing protein [Candidatus Sulfopaludibacter sp.]